MYAKKPVKLVEAVLNSVRNPQLKCTKTDISSLIKVNVQDVDDVLQNVLAVRLHCDNNVCTQEKATILL